MKQHLAARSFEDLLKMHGLNSHVNFPTYNSSLDPVIFDLRESSTGAVGSSDHYGIFTMINLKATHEEAMARTIWIWNKVCLQGFRSAPENVAFCLSINKRC